VHFSSLALVIAPSALFFLFAQLLDGNNEFQSHTNLNIDEEKLEALRLLDSSPHETALLHDDAKQRSLAY
jgi:hypothetical protein